MNGLMDTVALKRLEEMRDELDRSIVVLRATHPADAVVPGYPADPAEAGLNLTEAERTLAILEAAQRQHSQVLDALERLARGKYGICTECGRLLPEGRLEARPEAARCVPCQIKDERLQSLESHEIIATDAAASKPARPSPRTRCATGLAVRLLPPGDRARYREEFAAELADLPQCDQVPHALRLVCRAWSLRSSLKGGSRRAGPTSVVVTGATVNVVGAVSLSTLGWSAVVLVGQPYFVT